MKKGLTRIIYIASFGFLALTLYLNFIKSESNEHYLLYTTGKHTGIKGVIIIDTKEDMSGQKKHADIARHSL